MRAAHHHRIGLTGEADVIGIAPLAPKQHGVLRARDRLANRKPVVNAKLGSISVVVHRYCLPYRLSQPDIVTVTYRELMSARATGLSSSSDGGLWQETQCPLREVPANINGRFRRNLDI